MIVPGFDTPGRSYSALIFSVVGVLRGRRFRGGRRRGCKFLLLLFVPPLAFFSVPELCSIVGPLRCHVSRSTFGSALSAVWYDSPSAVDVLELLTSKGRLDLRPAK